MGGNDGVDGEVVHEGRDGKDNVECWGGGGGTP